MEVLSIVSDAGSNHPLAPLVDESCLCLVSYVGFLAFELGFIFLYLWETKGRTLEQTAVLFDGEPTADGEALSSFVSNFMYD